MLDAAKAWDLVFQDSDTFNRWAEDRFQTVKIGADGGHWKAGQATASGGSFLTGESPRARS